MSEPSTTSQAASTPPLRAAVVGARRVRQGTGEYLARELQRAGCQVVGVVGTRPESLEEARRGLRERHGIEARGYLTLEELLAREAPDVVAVASPSESHLESLEAALGAGCHVLCEKPLFWDPELCGAELIEAGSQGAAEEMVASIAERLVDLADAHGRLLALNTQWPCTLSGFQALHGAPARPLRSLTMWLGPDDPGPRMVLESASHILSLLYALAGSDGEVQAIEPRRGPEPDRMELAFEYAAPQGTVAALLQLRRAPRPPRPAGYEIDGRRVEREIRMPGYTFSFQDGGREVALPDPLAVLVQAFVAGARAGHRTDRRELVQGMRHLHRLVSAVAAPAAAGME